ncbi:hypothetical protein Rhal01_01838 [Rubritalea halochordaticola]|uniref:Ancillary SecYEG translocon subunit/Cell division coordinator CpoB TPR domain-containing protein n=1 Tax=Rubritalea halochordaticola TaxID=714537 RepID=A0ABP9UYY1_9BACT
MEDTPTPIAEIDHGPSKFEVFLEENQKKLIILAVAVFLGVLAYVFFSGYGEMQEQQASAKMQTGEYQATIQEYPGTKSAAAATIFLADEKAQSSNQEGIDQLQGFGTQFTDYPGTPSATVRLGLRLLDEGKTDEAEAQLSSVLDSEEAAYIAPLAKLALGDIALKNGNKEKAKTLYTEVSKLDQDGSTEAIDTYSGFISQAKARLNLMNAKAPREVQPKPAVTPAAPEADKAEPAEQPATPEADEQPQEEKAADTEQADTPADADKNATPEENTTPEENQEKNSQVKP